MFRSVLAGLRVKAVHPVNVIKLNRRRPSLHSKRSGQQLEQLIFGDHLEAITHLQRVRGVRTYFPDRSPDRKWLEEWDPDQEDT